MMDNKDKLRDLVVNVLLLEPSEFKFDLTRDESETWDSLAIVSMAVGIEETFGYHPTAEEAMNLRSVRNIIELLESKGVAFDS